MANKQVLIPQERIERCILLIRGQRVMLDSDLAALYRVETRVLKQAVRRNRKRFPADFMFELTKEENRALRSQNVTLKRGQHSKYLPFAFTEQGVAMLSSVLKSERAIEVNVEIMRAFVRLRQILASHTALARKLEELEKRYDAKFKVVFDAIRQLTEPPQPNADVLGFKDDRMSDTLVLRFRQDQSLPLAASSSVGTHSISVPTERGK